MLCEWICEWSLLYVFWLLCGGSRMWQAGILCAGKAVWWSAISIGGVWEGLCCHLAWNHGPVFLQEHKAPGRGSKKLPGGAWGTQSLWLEHSSVMEREEKSVCAQTQWGARCKPPGLLCVCRSGPLCTCGASCKATLCKSGELPPFSLLLRKNSQKMFLHVLGTTEKLHLMMF